MIRVLLILILISIVIWPYSLWSQWIQKKEILEQEPRYLIDTPTANVLPQRSLELCMRVYANGGMLGGLSIGLTRRLMVGGSYGGENVVGEGPVKWNPSAGVHFRYKIKPETFSYPGLAIGFESQGYGSWQDSTNRYTIKSNGFYAVVSKNYAFMIGGLGFHAGVNYSLERDDGDDDLNLFCGFSWMIDPELILHAEYDFAINDNADNSLGSGKGYLNAGFKWAFFRELFATRLFVEFDFKNLLKNKKEGIPYINRELKLVFMEYF